MDDIGSNVDRTKARVVMKRCLTGLQFRLLAMAQIGRITAARRE
jgi:hypothetical protein